MSCSPPIVGEACGLHYIFYYLVKRPKRIGLAHGCPAWLTPVGGAVPRAYEINCFPAPLIIVLLSAVGDSSSEKPHDDICQLVYEESRDAKQHSCCHVHVLPVSNA